MPVWKTPEIQEHLDSVFNTQEQTQFKWDDDHHRDPAYLFESF